RRRHTRFSRDWSSDVCSSDLTFQTRVARQLTLAKVRYRLALDLHIIDNGPGIPPEIRDRIFYPLVSGRDGGSGLGLTLAQTFVQIGRASCRGRGWVWVGGGWV